MRQIFEQSYTYKAMSDRPLWTQMCQSWLGISYCWETPCLRSVRPEGFHALFLFPCVGSRERPFSDELPLELHRLINL